MIDSNAGAVAGWLSKQLDSFHEEASDLPEEAAKRTHKRATDEVPVDTGALKDSLTQAEGEVYSTLDYAPHVGLGTIYMEQQDYLWGPAEEELKDLLTELAES